MTTAITSTAGVASGSRHDRYTAGTGEPPAGDGNPDRAAANLIWQGTDLLYADMKAAGLRGDMTRVRQLVRVIDGIDNALAEIDMFHDERTT